MKALRITNALLLLIIALNAFGGGWYALSGAPDVPLEWLAGTPFNSYFLPGLFLFVVVGGACLLTAVAQFKNYSWALSAGILCGLLLLVWIVLQVLMIGYVSWLQPAVLIAGLCITSVSWMLQYKRPLT